MTARAKAEAKTGHIYHGPVPGLEGLTRDIARAHGAVAAVGATPSTSSTSAATHSSSSATATTHHAARTSAPAASSSPVKGQPIKAKSGAGRTPARQVLVEDALHEGKIAVILFWNPKGTDDTVVNDQLKLLKAKRFAAFVSTAGQVASYGSITRGVQVYGTPSVLIVNTRGQTTVLTGVQDAFSIEQAIDEARNS